MRILLTTDTVGGVWTFTRELAEQLLLRGHSLALVSVGRAPSPAQGAWARELERRAPGRFRFIASDAPLEWMEANDRCWSEGSALMAEVIESFAPDLLHSSQYCFGSLSCRIPTILTAHSDVLSWAEACRPGGLPESAWLDRYVELVGGGLRLADCVVAPTRWMGNALLRGFHLSRAVRVIANGRSPRRGQGLVERRLQALTAGRLWDEAKGLSTLLERDWAMPVLVAGEDRFEGAVMPQALARVSMLGRLDEEQMQERMRESSVYIAPSLYEPFGLAPLEAALCGCALVVRDLASLREVWGEAALYFSDADQLAEHLRELADAPALLESMQAAAAERARQFSSAGMAESYLALYRSVVPGRKDEEAPLEDEMVMHAA